MTLRMQNVLKNFSTFKMGPLSLEIPGGKTAALVGPNGAGKTTLFQMLTANLRADEGKIWLNKEVIVPENNEVRRKIGYQSQKNELPNWVTAQEVLNYVAYLHNKSKERIEYFIKTFDITSFHGSPLIACSYGMQKRVSLAIAFLQDPEILILDEPFSGLDLFHMKTLEAELLQRKSQGKSTIISTHDFAFITKQADLCYFIEAGQISEATNWKDAPQIQRLAIIDERFFKT